jgi:hypothetical protein
VSRRLLPRDEMARRGPLLALSVVLMLAAFVLIGTGKAVLGFTLFVGAFLAVGLAKRA